MTRARVRTEPPTVLTTAAAHALWAPLEAALGLADTLTLADVRRTIQDLDLEGLPLDRQRSELVLSELEARARSRLPWLRVVVDSSGVPVLVMTDGTGPAPDAWPAFLAAAKRARDERIATDVRGRETVAARARRWGVSRTTVFRRKVAGGRDGETARRDSVHGTTPTDVGSVPSSGRDGTPTGTAEAA